LIETKESRERRKGTEKPLDAEEKKNLERTTSQKDSDLERVKDIHAKV